MISIDLHKKLNAPNGTMNLQINADFEEGEISALFGPSGAGKSSILKMMAGLMKPDKGKINWKSETWFDSERSINIKSRYRKIGYVFQEHALFPNMTILENIEYARSPELSKQELDSILEIMELGDLIKLQPRVLSGGQKRRCAIARALAQKPQILFLDEPFNGLDNKIKNRLQNFILAILKQFKITTILVSHDIRDVLVLSHRIFNIKYGEIRDVLEPNDFKVNGVDDDTIYLKARIIEVPKESNNHMALVIIGEEVYEVKLEKNDLKKGHFTLIHPSILIQKKRIE